VSQAGYCRPCGTFQKAVLAECPNENCGRTLTNEIDFESMCEALVWTSVFEDVSIPVEAADGSVTMRDQLKLVKKVRPYKSMAELGKDAYLLEVYYLTHMMFILSGWGAACLQPRWLFVEEYIFLEAQMDVAIKMKDAELCGEIVQALHILGARDVDPAMVRGYQYLLQHERRLKSKGTWVPISSTFYKRYHAAYCAIIGLAHFQFDPTRTLQPAFRQYFA